MPKSSRRSAPISTTKQENLMSSHPNSTTEPSVRYISERSLRELLRSRSGHDSFFLNLPITCVRSSDQPERTNLFGLKPWQWHRDYPLFK